MTPPRVFISYSHDSAEHKQWVLQLATAIRAKGIDAVLDQWDLKPGDDLPHFMETELVRCDYAVAVCTENYVAKANSGNGGVGYEKMIVSSTMLNHISESKIIPIIRQSSDCKVPTFLNSKLYIDFSMDSQVEFALDELLRALLNAPIFKKPEIGHNPFQSMGESQPAKTADGMRGVMTVLAAALNETSYGRVSLTELKAFSEMHRLVMQRYLIEAQGQGLVSQDRLGRYSATQKGIEYLMNQNII